MSLEVAALGAEHGAALRSLLSAEPLRHLRVLDALNDEGAYPGRVYGLLSAGKLLAAALVDGSSGGLLLSACLPEHARALGTSLARASAVQFCLGDRPAVEAVAAVLCRSKPRRLLPHRLFSASADNLGPYLTRALRLAEEGDCPRLVEMAAAELAEGFLRVPVGEDGTGLQAQVLDRVRRQRTWVLELGGSLVTKLDVAARTSLGAELEGIYTVSEHRFRGCATLALGQLSRDLLSCTPRLALRIADGSNGLLAAARKVGYVCAPVQQLLAVL